MDNSGRNAISINLERNNSFYFTGETVSGTVDLNIINQKLKADEIYIILKGEIGYTITSKCTEYHHIPFYSAKTVVAQPQPGEKELIFYQGQYSWPFQIPLTHHLPPTMNHPTLYPHVRYYLQVVIDKPWYESNTREKRYIMIYPHVNLLQNSQCLLSTIFRKHNRKEIRLKGTLNKIGYVPGEAIQFTLEIKNPQNVLIKNIDLSMLQRYQIGANTGGNTLFRITLPDLLNLRDQRIRKTFFI